MNSRCFGTALLTSLAVSACDEEAGDSGPAAKARSEAVAASQASSTVPSDSGKRDATGDEGQGKKKETESENEAKKDRKLCADQWKEVGKPFDPPESSRASAPDFDPPEKEIEVGGGTLTWVNFWAAWCKPCKEEIPRLRGWEGKLNAGGEERFRLVFVSLDDDERQLNRFMKEQPDQGLKQTYWLQDGPQRTAWLESVGMDPDPELPTHLLVDQQGKIRCVLQGAVEDGDWSRVQDLASTQN